MKAKNLGKIFSPKKKTIITFEASKNCLKVCCVKNKDKT